MDIFTVYIHVNQAVLLCLFHNIISINYVVIATMEPLSTNPLNQGHDRKTSIIRTIILVPTRVTNTFLTSERGKPLYCSKNG